LYPLDGDLEFQNEEGEQFQYVIKVVPTKLNTFKMTKYTYQYAVTQHRKTSLDDNAGIYFQLVKKI
jgi:hypothetical protein